VESGVVSGVDVVGYSNSDTGTAYIQQLGDNTFSNTEYVLPSRADGAYVTHHIDLTNTASGQMSFICKDAQIVANLYLYVITTGVKELTISSESEKNVYSIDGRLIKKALSPSKIQELPKGIYIIGNKKTVVK
ncbi:MAG: hypothetical protein IKX33_02810, partial [Prevotella sp.]|nr:hypothetical protein [Prevotella sp.]